MRVDDMLSPKRQGELEQLAAQLQRFHPTKVAVEAEGAPPSYLFKTALDPADLKTKANEVYQVGERVALGLGLGCLYGVDSPPTMDFDEVEKLDQKMTGGRRLAAVFLETKQMVAAAEQQQHAGTVTESLAWMNNPESIRQSHDFYMKLLLIQAGNDQPVAALDAGWYERNLRIWGKIMQIAQPGDRILVVIGQGHAYWLRTLAQQMPGYKLVDTLPYLTPRGE